MKKFFMFSIVFGLMLNFCTTQMVFAENMTTDTSEVETEKLAQNDVDAIKNAIAKYKKKNYVGCISDLKLYTQDYPESAIAWYYLGNSYMKIAMKEEAHNAFAKVVELNTVPKLTSYSIQAQICMENPNKCKYRDFSYKQIQELREDPNAFFEKYFASLNNEGKDSSTIEIENLINGTYSENIHPEVKEFIRQEKTKMKQSEINKKSSALSSDNIV